MSLVTWNLLAPTLARSKAYLSRLDFRKYLSNKERFPKIAQHIKILAPKVLCCQEVEESTLKFLSSRMESYHPPIFVPYLPSPPSPSWKDHKNSSTVSGNAIFIHNSISKVKHRPITISNNGTQAILCNINGLWIVNCQLDYGRSTTEDCSADYLEEQMSNIVDELYDEPTIICGDFGTRNVAPFIERGYISTGGTYPTKNGQKIDHILTYNTHNFGSKNMLGEVNGKCSDACIMALGTDHLPVAIFPMTVRSIDGDYFFKEFN